MNKTILALLALCLMVCTGKKTQQSESSQQQELEGIHIKELTDMRLIHLQDNKDEKRMPNQLFYGEKDSALVEQLSPEGSVAASMSCFLIQKDGKNILFDTGNGSASGGQLQKRLKDLQLSPSDIDYLFITHFHFDHIGGMTENDSAAFPNAEVYVPETEYAYWCTQEGDALSQKSMDAYAGRLHRFTLENTLPMGVIAHDAKGHTPGHTASEIGQVLSAGDFMHGAALQTQHPELCASYDMNREEAIQTRLWVSEYGKSKSLIIAGMHLPDDGLLKE